MFDVSKCNLCGDCLVKCLYVDYSREKAIAEMQALINGEDADILKECITCFACDEYCERGANPFDLINTLQEEKQSQTVDPEILKKFEPMWNSPTEVVEGEPGKPVLALCTVDPFLDPEMLNHPIFEGMTTVKGKDYFCNFVLPHLLKGSEFEAAGRQFIDNLAELNAKEVVFIHDECYAMIIQMEKKFGVKAPFKAVNIVEHMVRYLKKNKRQITRLNKKIAFQRSCSSRSNPKINKWVDKFCDLIGASRVKRQFDRECALCCGASIIALGKVEKTQEVQGMNFQDAVSNGAEAFACLCPVCQFSLKDISAMNQFPDIFIVDLFRMALGEIPFPEPQ
jgi:Fe-S oxidoreductase